MREAKPKVNEPKQKAQGGFEIENASGGPAARNHFEDGGARANVEKRSRLAARRWRGNFGGCALLLSGLVAVAGAAAAEREHGGASPGEIEAGRSGNVGRIPG